MDCSVPIRKSSWFGTGTVIVVSGKHFCITTWLPLIGQTRLNFLGRSRFIEQTNCFPKVFPGFFYAATLTDDIEFRAQRHVSVPFSFDKRRKILFHRICSQLPNRTRRDVNPCRIVAKKTALWLSFSIRNENTMRMNPRRA